MGKRKRKKEYLVKMVFINLRIIQVREKIRENYIVTCFLHFQGQEYFEYKIDCLCSLFVICTIYCFTILYNTSLSMMSFSIETYFCTLTFTFSFPDLRHMYTPIICIHKYHPKYPCHCGLVPELVLWRQEWWNMDWKDPGEGKEEIG